MKRTILLAILALFLFPAFAHGADLYVAPGGSDAANDCLTEASPCLTVNYAVSQAGNDDTIQIADGTYQEQVDLSSLGADSLTLRGQSTAGVTINGAATWAGLSTLAGPSKALVQLGSDVGGTVRIENLTLDGQNLQPACADPDYEQFHGISTLGKQLLMEGLQIEGIDKVDPSTPLDPGCVEASGPLYAQASVAAGARALSVLDSTWSDFLKYGAIVSGEDWNFQADNLTIEGAGSSSVRTQTGLLLGSNPLVGPGAAPNSARVENSSISNMTYGAYSASEPTVLSSAIRYVRGATARETLFSANSIQGVDSAVYASGQVAGVGGDRTSVIDNTISGAYRYGIIFDGGFAEAEGNTFSPGAGGTPIDPRRAITLISEDGVDLDVEAIGNRFQNGSDGTRALTVVAEAPLNTAAAATLLAQENSFLGYDPVYEVSGSDLLPAVNLNKNWWGCNEGPGEEAGCSSVGGPEVLSWLQLGLRSTPEKLLLPGTAIVYAEMLATGGDGDGSLSTNFPSAQVSPLEVSPLGTLGDASLTLVDGAASTTLTRGPDEEGLTTVSGTLNNATSDAEVGFWQALDNTVLPEITGSGVVDQELSVSSGTWTGFPEPTYAYQWQISDGSSGPWEDISGATGSSYIPDSEDAGKFLRVKVIANSPAGRATAFTDSFAVLNAAPSELLPPRIYGLPKVGKTLTTFPGIWNANVALAFSYQWQRSADGLVWTDIPGATAAEYVVSDEDASQSLRVNVTAGTPGGDSSASSAAVEVYAFAIEAKKIISGRPVSVGAGTVPVANVLCKQGECQILETSMSLRASKKSVSGGKIVYEPGSWSGSEKTLFLKAPGSLLDRLLTRKSGLLTIDVKISSSNGSVLEKTMRFGLRL